MINVLLADDHPIVRAGIKQLLATEHDIRVVGEAASGDEALTIVGQTQVDVLVLDISMPGPPYHDLIEGVRARAPAIRVLVLSMHSERQYAVRALQAGAAGYLTKDKSTEQLAGAIRHVYQGRRYVTPAVAEHLATILHEGQSSPHEGLSPREYDVFRMLVAGKTLKQIAGSLTLSAKTISTYRTRVMQKLDAQTTADLVRYALKHQLLDPNSG